MWNVEGPAELRGNPVGGGHLHGPVARETGFQDCRTRKSPQARGVGGTAGDSGASLLGSGWQVQQREQHFLPDIPSE